MADLSVTSLTIAELLKRLSGREWLIPKFQREFVWSVGAVIELIHSILCARPIGMATIWEQPDETPLDLGPLSLPDRGAAPGEEIRCEFASSQENPRKVYAVLDGLQRCTAVALAFGGFRTQHSDYRTSGRYYLNVSAEDPLEQIIFLKESDVIAKQFDRDAVCIAQGCFPLSSNKAGEPFLAQWLRYIQAIRDPSFYPNRSIPSSQELDRRDAVLKRAFEGISRTKLAVYIVPDTYSLPDICEIFETLNTTGTKVSTVDLIHSWLFAETAEAVTGPIRLREWIDNFGQKEGAIGWADASDRPELVVQMSTACHIALEEKSPPRRVGRAPVAQISSVKASDLLATPTEHWNLMISSDQQLAEYLGDFQMTVAGGLFPWKWCPYPVTAAIYVALRFHAASDAASTHRWGVDDLKSLFRAFFWRNALTNRYDQGFLTQLGTDIKELKRMLNERQRRNTGTQWAATVNVELGRLIARPLPSSDDLKAIVTDGRPGGALQKALYLPMLAAADKDLLDDSISLRYPQQETSVQMHHIYPRDWCRNNRTGALAELLDPRTSGRDLVESVANLMPLSRQSNNLWKAKIPGQVLAEKGITYTPSAAILRKAFIDEECFIALQSGPAGMGRFWYRRADLIVSDLMSRMNVAI